MSDVKSALEAKVQDFNNKLAVKQQKFIDEGFTQGEAMYLALASTTTVKIATLEVLVDALQASILELKTRM